MSLQKLKWIAIFSFVVAMVILLAGGFTSFDKLPPYPGQVVGPDGKVLFHKGDILAGQEVFDHHHSRGSAPGLLSLYYLSAPEGSRNQGRGIGVGKDGN